MYYFHEVWRAIYSALYVLFAPEKILSLPRRMLHLSTPAAAAVLMLIFLLAAVAATIVAAWLRPEETVAEVFWSNFPWIVALVLVIPIVTFYTVRAWLEPDASAFPDIDEAFRAGLQAVEKAGVDLRQTPLFLVLGSSDNDQEQGFFQASEISWGVADVPSGAAPLRWYGNHDAVYCVLRGVGCHAALSDRAPSGGVMASEQEPRKAARKHADIRMTAWPTTNDDAEEAAPDPMATQVFEPRRPASIAGTAMIDVQEIARSSKAPAPSANAAQSVEALPTAEAHRQRQRIHHLGRLLSRARRPVCAVNGALVLIPVNMILFDRNEGGVTGQCLKDDLDALMGRMQLRFPVITVITGWEGEQGFAELVSRMGRQKAQSNRFGGRQEPWAWTTADELAAVCANACGQFQDWVYLMYQAHDLPIASNRKLHAMLCKVRLFLQPRLEHLLCNAIGCAENQRDRLHYAGCYFTALGPEFPQRAFTPGIFDRLQSCAADLEWTDQSVAADRRAKRSSVVCYVLSALAAVALAVLLAMKSLPGVDTEF